jgi:hypothetical protein
MSSSNVHEIDASRLRALLALGLSSATNDGPPSSDEPRESTLLVFSRSAIRQLLSDLRQPLLTPDRGPLSFTRLTGASASEAREFEGQTLIKALTSSHTSRIGLEHLARFGHLLACDAFQEATQRTGTVVAALALVALKRRHDFEVEPAELLRCREVLQLLSFTEALPAALRTYADRIIRSL